MQIDLSKREVRRPKPQFKLTPKMAELKQQLDPIMWDMFLKFSKLWDKRGNHVNQERIMKEFRDAYPDMFKKADQLTCEYSKEAFKAAFNEDLENIEHKALDGDYSSWLKLLRFNIKYLEYDELREIIYKEHRRKKRNSGKSESAFLREVGRIISNPKMFDARLRTDFYQLLLSRYDPKKSMDKNLEALANDFEEFTEGDVRRQIMRFFKTEKKK